ncbi:MAG: beta-glucosidase, partial [Clostridiales bacterium]|nr:beta-glucosidase [Clostridiales bacterium]
MNNYKDTSLSAEQRANLLLLDMSVPEKMAQLQGLIFMSLQNIDSLRERCLAGIGSISCLQMTMMETVQECIDTQVMLQKIVIESSPHGIPAIFHMEGLCGAYVPNAVSFPSGLGRASSFDPELEEKIGNVVGKEERAIGITHAFAPVLDINRDPRMGRVGETYGEDATLSAALGAKYVKGCQQESSGRKTDCVAKHFLGFHLSKGGIHTADCEISGQALREIYAKPFQAAITNSGLRGIMPCYNVINGEPISSSKEL